MAFRDAYDRIVAERRRQGRLTQEQASAYLPAPITQQGRAIAGLLTGERVEIPKDPDFRKRIAGLAKILKGAA